MPSFIKALLKISIVLVVGLGLYVFIQSNLVNRLSNAYFSIVITSDVSGRLEPCGCFSGQMGGLTRAATWMKSKGQDANLKLDLGDAIAGQKDYHIHHYDYLLKAFSELGYDALNCGLEEAKLEPAQLKKISQESKVPMLSANLCDHKDQLFFKPYLSFEKLGAKIAIIGVIDEKKARGKLQPGVKLKSMSMVLSDLIPKLREEHDFLVLMAMTDEQGIDELRTTWLEVDLFLAGGVRQPYSEAVIEKGSVIVGLSGEGKNIALLEGQLLGRGEFKSEKYTIDLLTPGYHEDQNLLGLSHAYREKISKVNLKVDDAREGDENAIPGVKNDLRYVGSQACAACHAQAYTIWSQSGHAKAYHSLKHKKVEMDPECIRCHTVGFGEPSGFKRHHPQKHLEGVGCESCHGPGSQHIAERQSGRETFYRMRLLAESDCHSCHYGEFSRPFDWDAFWPAIKHGKEFKIK